MKIIDYTAGMEITAPMIVLGMPNEVYHGLPDSTSSTFLKEVFHGSIHTATRKKMDMSKRKHFNLGGIFHDLAEGFTSGYDVMDRYFIYPEYKKTAKAPIIETIKAVQLKHEGLSMDALSELEITLKGQKLDILKSTVESLLEKHAKGKTKTTDTELGQAEAMLGAMKEHPNASQWMSLAGESELSFFWLEEVDVDGETIKVLLKVRCDRFIETEDTAFILDWKSTAFVPTPKQIVNEQFKYGYDFSAAMYRYLVSKFTDKPIHFLNIFVSSADPCKENVSVVMFSEDDLALAFEDFQTALKKFAKWALHGGWTGVDLDPDNGFIQVPMRKFYGE